MEMRAVHPRPGWTERACRTWSRWRSDFPPTFRHPQRARLLSAEAARAQELAAAGILVQLWRVTGRRANVGIWNAPTGDALHEALESLPLFPFLGIHVVPVSRHPNAFAMT
jgi:muconolactone D-isomerase